MAARGLSAGASSATGSMTGATSAAGVAASPSLAASSAGLSSTFSAGFSVLSLPFPLIVSRSFAEGEGERRLALVALHLLLGLAVGGRGSLSGLNRGQPRGQGRRFESGSVVSTAGITGAVSETGAASVVSLGDSASDFFFSRLPKMLFCRVSGSRQVG